jgi:hypothetical protein
VKYFVKVTIEGSFPSGVENSETYAIPEELYNRIVLDLSYGISMGVVKVI